MPQRALRLAVSKPYAHFAGTCPCAKPTPNLSRHGRKLGFWQTSLRSFFKVPCPQTTTRLNSLALVSPAPPPPKINLTLPLFFSPWHSTRPCFHHPLPNDCVSGTAAPSNHHGREVNFARPTTTASPRRSRVRCTHGWAGHFLHIFHSSAKMALWNRHLREPVENSRLIHRNGVNLQRDCFRISQITQRNYHLQTVPSYRRSWIHGLLRKY